MEKLISIKDLNKTYKTKKVKKVIFDNLSFDIYKGDRVGILGKNGVGKTTLLNTIIGKTKPDSGFIEFSESINNRLRDLGYLAQEFKFPFVFKVKDIYKTIKKDLIDNNLYDDQYDIKIREILDINQLFEKYYKKLSGGEKQKLNLLSVLLYRPKILILDEFSSNIDLETSIKIRNFFQTTESTLILVSHNVKEISEICNKLIFLKEGKIYKELESKNINETDIVKIFKEMEIK